MKYKKLFEPIHVRGLELKNRIIFPAMGSKMAGENGFINQKLIDYHVARAEGGNGLNMLEVASVHKPSAPKGFVSLAEAKYVPKMRELVDAVHAEGGKIGVQLWQGAIAVLGDKDAEVFVPSDTQDMEGNPVAGASIEKIEEVIESYGKAAKRAVEAGFDTLEIHAGHNYSPHMFLSEAFNKRDDKYGGSLENRARYLVEIVEEVRKNIPENMPLFIRIVAKDDYLEDGLSIDDMIKVSNMAKDAGVDVLNISRGNIVSEGIKYEVPPIDIEKGFNVENARKIKEGTGMLVQAVGRINDPKQADEILESGIDFVTVGRGQLADAEFANKAMEGRAEDIVKCIGCNQGCYDAFVDPEMEHITCVRNPAVGREKEYELRETKYPEKVAVVGGGMGGLEAAFLLKEKGHEPVLFEMSDKLGGQLLLAGVAPRKDEMGQAAVSRAEQVHRAGIKIRMETEFTKDILKEEGFDSVIIAKGSAPIKLGMPGADLDNMILSHEILSGEKKAEGKIAVIGGGLVGLELAEYFGEAGDEVTVMEMQEEVAADLGQLRRISVMESLAELGTNIKTSVNCKEITEDSLIYEEDGEEKELDVDYVIMAVGSASKDSQELKNYCDENEIPVYTIGDAVRARRAFDAIKEAADVVLFQMG